VSADLTRDLKLLEGKCVTHTAVCVSACCSLCCGVLQCVAVRCSVCLSVLQFVLQCVAVCCRADLGCSVGRSDKRPEIFRM